MSRPPAGTCVRSVSVTIPSCERGFLSLCTYLPPSASTNPLLKTTVSATCPPRRSLRPRRRDRSQRSRRRATCKRPYRALAGGRSDSNRRGPHAQVCSLFPLLSPLRPSGRVHCPHFQHLTSKQTAQLAPRHTLADGSRTGLNFNHRDSHLHPHFSRTRLAIRFWGPGSGCCCCGLPGDRAASRQAETSQHATDRSTLTPSRVRCMRRDSDEGVSAKSGRDTPVDRGPRSCVPACYVNERSFRSS
ncbi:hypothetical protein K466DRAFT_372966 [Polyporus arcularius HHB13444]|uniref:Uncharacterized protein n=1 Tax=Polyporus arcularius HHB13444 TaxID=1314778 RepID=A0A5C3NVM9_9APHY|nr:hypothetical protein K466DRAFT_372966 [Polyporus arcularius HHB13444]